MEIRLAETAEDRLAVIDVACAANGITGPRALYQARRLTSPLRARAAWWLLRVGGAPAASLLCYPLRFEVDGRIEGGWGLGSVACHPDWRGRALGRARCRAAADDAIAGGRSVGLLFSAIDPAYYQKLGYQACAAWAHACDPAVLPGGPRARLTAIDPSRSVGRLIHAWRGLPERLRLARDEAGWARSLAVNPGDLFFAVGEAGYARLALDDDSVEIVELACGAPDDAIRAIAALAAALGRPKLSTWLSPTPLIRAAFTPASRAKTLPMVHGADSAGSAFYGADYF